MGILRAAGQLFNTARKSPIAGKFLQRAFKGGASKVDDVLRGTPLGNNPVVRAGKPSATSVDSVRSRAGSVIPGGSARMATQGAAGGNPVFNRSTPFVPWSPRTPVASPPKPNLGTQLIQRGSAAQTGNKVAGKSSLLRRLGPVGSIGLGAFDLKGELDAGRSPVDAVGRTIFGTAGSLLAGRIPGLGLVGSTAGYPAGAGFYDFLKGEMVPDVPADIVAIRERRLAKEGKTNKESNETKEPSTMYGTIPPSVNTNLGAYDPGVTLPGGGRNPVEEISLNDNSPFVPAPNNLPSSPEAVVANPLQQKMAEYEQGRAKATTQEEMNAVRDLGLSIHQAANPQMYEESYNPLMAATFPERYTKTPEDFIVQGGIQAPRSMIEKDAAQATAFGNKVQNIENLDVNPMYNPFEEAKALAAVTASRRFKP